MSHYGQGYYFFDLLDLELLGEQGRSLVASWNVERADASLSWPEGFSSHCCFPLEKIQDMARFFLSMPRFFHDGAIQGRMLPQNVVTAPAQSEFTNRR